MAEQRAPEKFVKVSQTNEKDLMYSQGYLHSMSNKQQEMYVVVEGTSVYLDVEAVGGGDIEYNLNGVYAVLDCTTGSGVGGRARVELLQGTSTSPKTNLVYMAYSEQDGIFKLFSSEVAVKGVYAYVAIVGVQDYLSVITNGAMYVQRTTEATSHEGRGAISWMREKLRIQGAEYWSGVDQALTLTTNPSSEDSINFHVTEGVIYQLHKQDYPESSVAVDGIYVVNPSGTLTLNGYDKVFDMNTLKEDDKGNQIQDGDITTLVIYGAANYESSNCKLFVNLPSGFYTDSEQAEVDLFNYANTTIPSQAKTTGFLIARVSLRYNSADSGTWTNVLTNTSVTWSEEVASVISPNYPSNYPNGVDETTVMTIAGKEALRVYFDAFNTEANYDFVYLLDGADNLIHTYNGNLGSFTSDEVLGDVIKVRFVSDSTVNRAGFNITALEGKATVNSGSTFVDLRGVKYGLGGGGGVSSGISVTLASDNTTQETLTLNGQEITTNLVTQATDGVMSSEDKLKFDNISGNSGGSGWIIGLEVVEHSPKNQTVDYQSGSYLINGDNKAILSSGVYDLENGYLGVNHYTGFTSYQHAFVLIYVDADEVIKSVSGGPVEKNESPNIPPLPDDTVPLAVVEIKVDNGASPKDISRKNITDSRNSPSVNTDEFVSISADDTTTGHLADKLSNNGNVQFTVENIGGDETLKADVNLGAINVYGTERVKVYDTSYTASTKDFDTPDASNTKLVLTTGNLPAGNYQLIANFKFAMTKDAKFRAAIWYDTAGVYITDSLLYKSDENSNKLAQTFTTLDLALSGFNTFELRFGPDANGSTASVGDATLEFIRVS